MPGARLALQQSLRMIRLKVMMLISIVCTINRLKRKKNIVTDALYRSICFCPLEKGFSHPDRKWLLWFIHKLSSWYVLTSRSIQLSPLNAEQRQHDISVVKASACKSPVLLLVYRKTIASHTQEQMEQNQLQKYLHTFIKHPPFCNFTNISPVPKPDTLSTTGTLLAWSNPNPHDISHIVSIKYWKAKFKLKL